MDGGKQNDEAACRSRPVAVSCHSARGPTSTRKLRLSVRAAKAACKWSGAAFAVFFYARVAACKCDPAPGSQLYTSSILRRDDKDWPVTSRTRDIWVQHPVTVYFVAGRRNHSFFSII